MRSALGEPPLSGPNQPACAGPARTSVQAAARVRRRGFRRKAAGILFMRRRAAASGALELRRALLHERQDALDEVLAGRHLLLDVGLQRELALHPLEDPAVELALRACIRAGRAGGEAVD